MWKVSLAINSNTNWYKTSTSIMFDNYSYIITFSFISVYSSLWLTLRFFLVLCVSSRPVRPRGPHRRHHFCRKLSGLDSAAVRQDTVEERAHDAGSRGRQSHQGEQGVSLSWVKSWVKKLRELACTSTLSSLISAKHHNKIFTIKELEIKKFQYDTLRTSEESRLRLFLFNKTYPKYCIMWCLEYFRRQLIQRMFEKRKSYKPC